DVVLTAEERTTPDPKCAENFDNPSSEKNVFLDGAEIDISPEEPLEVQDITLVNGAEWNLRDGFVSARVVDAHNSSINLFNSYLKAETFIDPGGSNGGGITFNPSFLEAERIVLYKPETLIQIGLGGKLPAGPDALGAGHHARMSGDFVSLDVTLDIFTLYGFHPKPGQQFEIISVGNSLEGEFVNAPEGSVIDGFCDVQLRISYMGGDGNDVVLTAEETERTWPCEKTPDGNNWSDSDSWENGVPNATDDVVLDNSSMLVAQEDIEIKRMTVKNGATLQIEDSIFIAEEIRVDGGTVQVNNTELVLNQTGVFCEICGMSLNPSYLDTQSLRATGKYFSFALGGEKPANTGAVGSGYHARISAKGVELDTELEVSFVYDFQPQAGQEFEIITVDDSLRGAFINAPEGAVVGGYCDVELKISYTGGDGNDVVLSAEKTTNPDPNWPCEDQKEEAENMNAPSQDLGGEEKTSSLLPFLGGILIIIIFVAVLRKKKKA
ncbi:MAG: hypothetical protein GY755_23730, partial [Chloroflexi bacterium]|nr:hypothetical protein [Chloroflexota bacterium]